MFSTLTKVLAAATATSAIATGFSIYHDHKIGDIEEIPDVIADVVPDEEATDVAAEEILNSVD